MTEEKFYCILGINDGKNAFGTIIHKISIPSKLLRIFYPTMIVTIEVGIIFLQRKKMKKNNSEGAEGKDFNLVEINRII